MSVRVNPGDLGILCTGGPLGGGGGSSTRPVGLRDRLRTESGPAHVAAEAAMDLPWRLRTLARYIELLRTFEALHRACDPVIDGLLAIAAPSLSPGWSRRRERLSADLRQLRAGAVIPVLAAPALPTIDHAVGALYVFEGSALGGLRIAGEVDRRLPAARGARRYFTGEGRGTAARWRDVQSALAGWEHRGVQAGDRAVAGALETFALIDAQLRATGVA